MGYDIVSLETQNHGQDWPLIVTAVECPTCGAKPGEMCVSVGTTEGPTAVNPHTVLGQQRIDWHATRKHNAAAAWYNRDKMATQPEEAPVEESVGVGLETAEASAHPVASEEEKETEWKEPAESEPTEPTEASKPRRKKKK